MDEPIISPDGKFVWTRSGWAPLNESEEFDEEKAIINQEKKQIYDRERGRLNPPRYNHKIEQWSVIIGIVVLAIVFYSYSRYQHSICGTILSPLVGDDCTLWNTLNLIFGSMGILVIILGLIGKKVAENPIEAILFELQFSRPRLLELEKKIGINPTLLRHLLNDLKENGIINEVRERNHIYYELK